MADSGGHWKNLAEIQKLTQSTLVPGIIEEDIKFNNPIDHMPMTQASGTGTSMKWIREKASAVAALEDAVQNIAPGGQLTWSEDVEYDTAEATLKICYIQRKLDNYVQAIYGNYNNYKAIVLMEMEKAIKRKLGKKIIYDDVTYGVANSFDGWHAIAAEQGAGVAAASDLNIDMGETALSLATFRQWIDAMKYGIDQIWMPTCLARKFDAAYQEKGFAGLASATAGTMAQFSYATNQLGQRVALWDGIPIIRSDYLVAEQANSGLLGTSLRAAYSSGTRMYSIFAVKYGNPLEKQPGVSFGFGNTPGQGDFYRFTPFEKLEDYDGEGMRMVNYSCLLPGSSMAIARIADITDAAITV